MEFINWLNTNNQKCYLVTKNVAVINALIRQNHISMKGVKVTSLSMLAKDIVSYAYAKKQKSFHLLSNEYAQLFFQNVLKENIQSLTYYCDHQEILNSETVNEIYRIFNVVRLGHTRYENMNDLELSIEDQNRIDDLFQLIDIYQSELQTQGYLDEAELLITCLEELNTWNNNEMYLNPVTVVQDESEKRTYIEEELIARLQQITNPEVSEVSYPNYLYDFYHNQKHGDVSFFKGFGSVNEVKYVIHDILEKQIPFGETSIQYISPSSIYDLKSELDAAKIPYAFTDGIPATSNPFIKWLLDLITWAQNNFEEEYLYPVLEVPYFKYEVDEETYINTKSLINIIVKGSYKINDAGSMKSVEYHAGWDIQRYFDLIPYFTKSAINPNYEALQRNTFLYYGNLLESLFEIFKYRISLSTCYEKMIQFLDTYLPSNQMDYIVVKDALHNLIDYYKFMNIDLSESEVYMQIKEDLEKIRISDIEKQDGITIQSINHFHILERKHNYVIGMSAVNMKQDSSQSPVLSDAELMVLVQDSYLPISTNENPLNQKYIQMTLSSREDSHLTIGYPFYDTQEETECNPSVIYLDILNLYSNDKDTPIFEYGLPKNRLEPIEPLNRVIDKAKDEHLFDVCSSYSASSLKTLSECPRKFYYEKVKNLRPIEFLTQKPSKWLDASSKGNFIHSILESYTRTVFKNGTDCSFDENQFNEVIYEQFTYYKSVVPTVEDWIMEKEVNEISKKIKQYLNELHEEYKKNQTVFLLAEERFNSVTVQSEIALPVNGQIDRIDARIDRENKMIYLRTIDYKTGKKENIENSVTIGEEQQRKVYTTALFQDEILEHIKKRLHKLDYHLNLNEYAFKEEGFYYVFIGDEETTNEDQLITMTAKKVILNDDDDMASAYRLSSMIHHCIEEGEFLDRFTIGQKMLATYDYDENDLREPVIASLCGEMAKNKKKRNKIKTKCTYCPYVALCDKAIV